MHLKWTRPALKDLKNAGDFIALDNPIEELWINLQMQYELGKIALRFKPLIQEKAEKNKRISGKIYGEKHPKQEVSPNLGKPLVPIDTKKELAEIAGVSHGTIANNSIF